MTRRRFVLGWTGFCAAGWLIVGGLAEGNEEHCRAADGYRRFARRSGTAAELRVPAQSDQREIREEE